MESGIETMNEFILMGYVGPETIGPLASILAAAVGTMMMMGNNTWQFIKEKTAAILGRSQVLTSNSPDSQSDANH